MDFNFDILFKRLSISALEVCMFVNGGRNGTKFGVIIDRDEVKKQNKWESRYCALTYLTDIYLKNKWIPI